MNNDAVIINTLNRLLAMHSRSLAAYLQYALPWTSGSGEEARETVADIAADQQQTAERLGRLVLERGGDITVGPFPIRFTAYNDVSLSYLVTVMIELQEADIAAITECLPQLEDAPLARAVVEEALGAAKAHLDSLRELAGESTAA